MRPGEARMPRGPFGWPPQASRGPCEYARLCAPPRVRASPRGWVPPAPSPGSFDEKGAFAPWGCWRRRAGRPTAWELPGARARDASIAVHQGGVDGERGEPAALTNAAESTSAPEATRRRVSTSPYEGPDTL